MNSRNARDVHRGGLFGIAGSMLVGGGLALLIVAGAHGLACGDAAVIRPPELMTAILGANTSAV